MKFKMKYTAPLAAMLLLAACNSDQAKDEKNTGDVADKETGSYTVVDDRGKEITFEKTPETIISLQPSNTEILFSLGAGEKIIGATDYDTYPEAANDIERVSTSTVINAERIVELNPDVVIAYTSGDEAQVTQLEDAGLQVFVIKSAATFEDVYGDIEQLGDVVRETEKADDIIEEIQTHIKEVQEKTATVETKKKVYLEISPAPEIWTTASETFQNEILEAAGVENIFADQNDWFSVAEEDVITRNPELIITTVNYIEDPIGEIKSRASWNTIQAIENDAVYQLDNDILSRPATRIGEAVQLVAETVYPDLFK
jgi:iron complex transport system substrate-binding protein